MIVDSHHIQVTMTTRRGCNLVERVRTLILIGALSPIGSDTNGEDWPNWRGPGAAGVWRQSNFPQTVPSNGFGEVWSHPVGPGYSGLAVANGRVFTLDRPKDPPDSERIVCLSATTGKVLWEYVYNAIYGKLDYGKGPRCTPTIYQGRVYTLGAVGHFVCLEEETGRVVWSRNMVQEAKAVYSTWGLAASPVIYRDLVVLHAGVQPGGCFSAYDRISGQERWRSGKDPTGYCTPILIEHNGQDVMIGWTPENVVALSPADGKELWQIPYKVTYGVSIATPIFRDRTVFVAGYWEGSKAIRLGRTTTEAELLWEENRNLRGLMSQPLYRDGYVYLLDKQYGLVCFEFTTGKVVWTDKNRLTPRGQNPQANLVWLDDGPRCVALNANGELVVCELSPTDYRETGRTKIIGETWAHPAFYGSRVFARDDDRIVCLDVAKSQ